MAVIVHYFYFWESIHELNTKYKTYTFKSVADYYYMQKFKINPTLYVKENYVLPEFWKQTKLNLNSSHLKFQKFLADFPRPRWLGHLLMFRKKASWILKNL